ncbi:MAG: pantoate kinase [Candidatus Heimdallarchaeota archaeon]
MSQIFSSKWSVPAHITGLFQIVENENPLEMGSRGAGFSINNPVITQAEFHLAEVGSLKVFFNGVIIDGKVSAEVASSFNEYWNDKELILNHSSQLPTGAGFGSSGAGALGAAFALNELFDAKKSKEELGQIAHQAEVNCRTGLGDVIAQYHGLAEIRLEPGAPGIGVIKQLEWPIERMILSIFLGTMSTKEIITSKSHIEMINQTSEPLLKELLNSPTVDTFVDLSYQFSKKVGLMSTTVETIVEELRTNGCSSSMIMIGESVFVIGSSVELKNCVTFLKEKYPKAQFWINSLALTGPSIVSK